MESWIENELRRGAGVEQYTTSASAYSLPDSIVLSRNACWILRLSFSANVCVFEYLIITMAYNRPEPLSGKYEGYGMMLLVLKLNLLYIVFKRDGIIQRIVLFCNQQVLCLSDY